MADGESSGKKPRGFGFFVKIVAAVVIVLAVVVIVGDDETRAALLSRLRGMAGRRQIPERPGRVEPRSGLR